MALVIFDIDGTLFETWRVTAPAVQRTFARYGLAEPETAAICAFTGKPVAEYHGWLAAQCRPGTAEEIIAATDRLELELVGTEGRLYDGIREGLDALLEAGHTLAVCSNAPDDYMATVLDAHGIRPLLRQALCRGSRPTTKTTMVRDLMEAIPDRPVVVVGDRGDDIDAARANGALAIGASYGFGSREELQPADALAASAGEVASLVERLIGSIAAGRAD